MYHLLTDNNFVNTIHNWSAPGCLAAAAHLCYLLGRLSIAFVMH